MVVFNSRDLNYFRERVGVCERNGVERKQENRMVCACMYTCVREEVSKKESKRKRRIK